MDPSWGSGNDKKLCTMYYEYLWQHQTKYYHGTVLGKANSHSVDISRLIKSQQGKRRSRRTTDSTFDFSQAAK